MADFLYSEMNGVALTRELLRVSAPATHYRNRHGRGGSSIKRVFQNQEGKKLVCEAELGLMDRVAKMRASSERKDNVQ